MASSELQRRRVIYPHEGCEYSGALSLTPGDVLEVDQAEGQWWTGRLLPSEGRTPPLQTGLFYSKFTVPVEPSKPAAKAAGNLSSSNSSTHSVIYQLTDYVSQSKPNDDMTCIICYSLASRTHQTMCCGQTVCLDCAETWKKNRNCCPQCRKVPLKLSVDVRMERYITNLKVHCRHHTDGCDWVGRLGFEASHSENSCHYVMVKCARQGCSMEVRRCDLKEHMTNTCQLRKVACPCCTNNYYFGEIFPTHYKWCPDWPMRCLNKCPQDNLTRASLQAHLDEDCPEQLISCQFSEAGCGVTVKRREMEEHLQNAAVQHAADMKRNWISMKNELAKYKEDNRNMTEESNRWKKELAVVVQSVSKLTLTLEIYSNNDQPTINASTLGTVDDPSAM